MTLRQVLTVWTGGEVYEFSKLVPRKWARSGAAQSMAGTVTSPMPGKIIKVSHQSNIQMNINSRRAQCAHQPVNAWKLPA